MKWEYKVIDSTTLLFETAEYLSRELTRLGEEGWELMEFIEKPKLIIFKRLADA